MPLIKGKSKESFSKNVATEMDSGKPQKQSLAIAYAVQRKAKKKMFGGGRVKDEETTSAPKPAASPAWGSKEWAEKVKQGVEGKPVQKAHGGEIHPSDLMSDEERSESIVDAIMRKRKMADGGMVDLEENSEEEVNQYYGLNSKAADEPQYDDSQLEDQPMDSNEHGDDIESDKHDMVSRIRAKLRKGA